MINHYDINDKSLRHPEIYNNIDGVQLVKNGYLTSTINIYHVIFSWMYCNTTIINTLMSALDFLTITILLFILIIGTFYYSITAYKRDSTFRGIMSFIFFIPLIVTIYSVFKYSII